MADLQDYTFELGGVVFGTGRPVSIDGENGFDPGTDDTESQDSFNSWTDSVAFGSDAKNPAAWIWALHTNTARFADDAITDSAQLALAWDAAVDRRTPGAVAALRYGLAGRTRVVYGRPRRFATTMDNGLVYGFQRATAEFQRADVLFYADEANQISLSILPEESIGFVTPIVTPLTTLSETPTVGVTPVVGGDAPAPFIATIHGPDSGSITNPRIYTDDWEIELRTSIQAGESVEINTYPWGLSATRSDGANIASFSPKTRFSKARLKTTGESVRFDGIDSSGTASATISWRTAYKTI